jgi:putative aldouronate transport system permease protein
MVMLLMSIAGILSNGMEQYLVFSNAMNKDVIEVLDLYVYNMATSGTGMYPLSTAISILKSLVSIVLLFITNTASKLIRGEGFI